MIKSYFNPFKTKLHCKYSIFINDYLSLILCFFRAFKTILTSSVLKSIFLTTKDAKLSQNSQSVDLKLN